LEQATSEGGEAEIKVDGDFRKLLTAGQATWESERNETSPKWCGTSCCPPRCKPAPTSQHCSASVCPSKAELGHFVGWLERSTINEDNSSCDGNDLKRMCTMVKSRQWRWPIAAVRLEELIDRVRRQRARGETINGNFVLE